MVLVSSTALLAEEQAPSPPTPTESAADPLNLPAEPVPSRGGYFGASGSDAVSALAPPARIQVGDFALQSRASFSTVYDDNIEADDDVRDDDVFFSFAPSIRAQSLYARHSLGLEAGATAATAAKNEAEDIFDWRVGADGRFDISRQSKINGAFGYRRDTEDDEAIDAENNEDDLTVNVYDASVSYNQRGDTISYRLGSTVSRLDAEGSNFADRDRTSLGLTASTSYILSDRLSVFLGPSYQYSTFDEEVADDGEGRDAQIFSGRLGGRYKASRTINTQASIGYSLAKFEDSDRDDADSFVGNLGLVWDPGTGTTLQLQAGQTLGLTVIDDADSRTTTFGAATLSHRLKLGSKTSITSTLSYRVSEFSDLDRTDQDTSVGLSYAYRLAENVFFNAGYRFSRRDSDEDDAEFYRNLISLGIVVSY